LKQVVKNKFRSIPGTIEAAKNIRQNKAIIEDYNGPFKDKVLKMTDSVGPTAMNFFISNDQLSTLHGKLRDGLLK